MQFGIHRFCNTDGRGCGNDNLMPPPRGYGIGVKPISPGADTDKLELTTRPRPRDYTRQTINKSKLWQPHPFSPTVTQDQKKYNTPPRRTWGRKQVCRPALKRHVWRFEGSKGEEGAGGPRAKKQRRAMGIEAISIML